MYSATYFTQSPTIAEVVLYESLQITDALCFVGIECFYTSADIDECQTTQAAKCEHRCANTLGSFQCYCNEGYSVEGNKCKSKHQTLELHLAG